MQRFTVEDIMKLDPCYDRETVAGLWAGRAAITAREIFALDIPISDRHWVILRLRPPSQNLLNKWVERAIARVDRTAAGKTWCAWADKWKSGDRSAARAVGSPSAARAAWSAASEAAWSAASEAAWSAEQTTQIEELFAEHEAKEGVTS